METSSSPAEGPAPGHRLTSAARRVAVTVIGVVVLLAGVAMMFLPGPGALTVIAGLALLGTEYTWARRSVTWARRRFHDVVHSRRRDDEPDGERREPGREGGDLGREG